MVHCTLFETLELPTHFCRLRGQFIAFIYVWRRVANKLSTTLVIAVCSVARNDGKLCFPSQFAISAAHIISRDFPEHDAAAAAAAAEAAALNVT